MGQPLWRDREWLEKYYVRCKLSTLQMARLARCSDSTIVTWLKKYSIPRRTHKEAYEVRTTHNRTRSWIMHQARMDRIGKEDRYGQ